MRDDDHRAIAVVQHIFQPADGVDVEVVGRLVQQQNVRVGEQRLYQQHTQFPARGDGAHRAVVLFDRDAYAQQQFAGACFGRIAVVFCIDTFEFGGLHVVIFGRFRIHVDGVFLDIRLPHLFMAHHDHIQHAFVFIGELILTQPGHALVVVHGDVAGAGFQHSGQNFHEGGFAATVGADEAVAVAFAELDRNILEQRLGAELHGDVVAD